MTLRLVTDASAEPVSVADLKTFLRIPSTETAEDALLAALEKSARAYCENYTKRPCLPETFKLVLDSFPDKEIPLLRAPLSTSTTDVVITYLDALSGDSTTLSTTVYDVDTDAEPGRVFLKDGESWPDHWTARNAVQIQFVAGFKLDTAVTPATDTCPEDIETWIKMRVAALYENREPVSVGAANGVNVLPHSFVDGLLDRHVLIDVRP